MDRSKTALITGVIGQDGAYLSELLLAKGYVVHGIKRRSSSFNTARIEHLYQDPPVADPRFVEIWGSGTPRREFLHVDDLADACVHLMRHYSDERPINVASGEEIRIVDLARLVADVVGFAGTIVHDGSKPDGTPRKLLDSRRLRDTGWRPRIGLRDGIGQVYAAWQAGRA